VPIHASEAAYVREHGHRALEEIIERERVDLLDPARAAVV
jgi:hypothetical protein